MSLQPFVGPWPLFSFLILYTVDRTPWTGDQPVEKILSTHRTAQTQNKYMETVHALDRVATVMVVIKLFFFFAAGVSNLPG
jgi:hypothetical protein